MAEGTTTKKKTTTTKTTKVETPKKETKKSMSLQEQAAKILEIAEKSGVQSNFFFITTFKRYQVQMTVLSLLEKEIEKSGAIVTKEYVKGRQNLYTNPAVDQYNKTASAANNTVGTLINIVKTLRPEDAKDEDTLDDVMSSLLKAK